MQHILKYEQFFSNGLWHVHTHYTDGKHSVEEICGWANSFGYPLVCFAEHIRRIPDYDVEAFLASVEKAAKKWPDLIVLSGMEAKVLPEGVPDCHENLMDRVDVLFLAEHSFEGTYFDWLNAMKAALKTQQVQVWAHPLLLPLKKSWTVLPSHFKELCNICRENGVAVELNKRYPKLHTAEVFRDYYPKIQGFDLHELSPNQNRIENYIT